MSEPSYLESLRPLLEEHYPGRGLSLRPAALRDAVEVVGPAGDVIAEFDYEAVVQTQHTGDETALEPMFRAIDAANQERSE